MRSPFNFIVRPHNGRRYDNIKNVGGIDLITSTSQEDHTTSNRYATVVSTPINYSGDIEPGDTLIVHHNVFKYYYDMKGRQKSGRSFIKDDLFLVDDFQYYMYKRNDVWKSKDEFCFIRPIPKEQIYIYSPGVEQPLMGEIVYTNNILLSYGLDVGDVVSFRPDSEYEFNINGEKLYRVRTDWITWTQEK
jgi:hypothetical protein